MSDSKRVSGNEPASSRIDQIRADLKRVERRDWSLWVTSFTVMVLLTAAVVSLSVPTLLKTERDAFLYFQVGQAVRGLVGLVLLFNIMAIYQLFLNKNLRGELERQIETTTREQARADNFYKLAILDPLTELHNRRFAEERLTAEIARSARHGCSLAVMILDLNDFKKINDSFGHAAGDDVLRHFAGQLKKVIRGSDLAARIGGDEFLVILPECPAEQVQRVLERIGPFEIEVGDQRITFSASAGWADYRMGEAADTLLLRADQALYLNKRNRPPTSVPVKSSSETI